MQTFLEILTTKSHNSTDFEIWTRGSEDDYNRFASVSGDEGWSWNNMMQYFKKVRIETFIKVTLLVLIG